MNYLKAIIDAIKANPVRTVAVIRSAILVGIAFGLPMTPDQQTAVLTLAAVLFAVDEGVRTQVTPTADPKLAVGDVVTTPTGAPAIVVPATPAAIEGAIPEVDDPDQ